MKNKNKFTIPSKYILAALSVLCIASIIITYTTDITGNGIKTAVGYVIIPIQKGVNEVGLLFDSKADDLKSLRKVMQENDELRSQVDELVIENSSLQQDKYELDRLRELYKLDQQYKQFNKVGALSLIHI